MKIEFLNFNTKKIRVQLNKKEYGKTLIYGYIKHKGPYRIEETTRNLNMFFISKNDFKNLDDVASYILALSKKINTDKRFEVHESKIYEEMNQEVVKG